jgi:tetratricopeptide (TPR) repeat protein
VALRRRPRLLGLVAVVAAFSIGVTILGALNGSGSGPALRTPHSALPGSITPSGLAATLGDLNNARHDFRAGLHWGEEARRLNPDVVRPLGVIADAQIELGRYDAAARTIQRMVDLKPNLASYARVSYYRELHGDLDGAADAMRLAIGAGGSPESMANVLTLLGGIELERGDFAAARNSYRGALARVPDYQPAYAGLARADFLEGNYDSAIERYRSVVDRLPLPEYAIALGEAELAAGDRAAAARSFDLVRAERQLLTASGINTDAEYAIFEADHGDPRRGVELGRAAYEAAPSVRSADAYGWALTRAGRPDEGLKYARKALRLGSKDPAFLRHARVAEREAGL